MLRARRSGIEVYSGDRTRLNRVRYLVVLDSDTDPGWAGSARWWALCAIR